MPSHRRPTRAVGAPRHVLVDSGAWIALVRAADQHHTEADRMFRHAAQTRTPLLTTTLIIAEVHRFILFHVGIRAAALLLERMDASPLLTTVFVGADHHAAARRWIDRLSDQVITYTDAVSFAVMTASRCHAVMTFDHDFVTAGFQIWRP